MTEGVPTLYKSRTPFHGNIDFFYIKISSCSLAVVLPVSLLVSSHNWGPLAFQYLGVVVCTTEQGNWLQFHREEETIALRD